MNVLLWILQAFLALHTVTGAVWKLSNPAQGVPSLKAIPNSVWLALSGFELLIAVCLIVPAFFKRWAFLVPVAALCIVGEMLLFSGAHLLSGETDHNPMVYWLVAAGVCAFVAYGRSFLRPAAGWTPFKEKETAA